MWYGTCRDCIVVSVLDNLEVWIQIPARKEVFQPLTTSLGN